MALRGDAPALIVRRGISDSHPDSHPHRDNVDPFAAFVEGDLAVHQGEQRPVSAGADIAAGHEFGAALADNDAAGADKFAAVGFYTEPFADTVASVANASLTFLMSHNVFLCLNKSESRLGGTPRPT